MPMIILLKYFQLKSPVHHFITRTHRNIIRLILLCENIIYHDNTCSCGTSLRLPDTEPNLAKNKFIFRLNIPEIYFKGDYDIDMNVLILKYKGQGPITGNFSDLTLDVLMKGKIKKINNQNHLQFDKFILHLNIGKTHLHLGNLFAQDPNIGRATNEVVNENSETFVKEIQPALEQSLAEKFTAVANIITSHFTYEELFPES